MRNLIFGWAKPIALFFLLELGIFLGPKQILLALAFLWSFWHWRTSRLAGRIKVLGAILPFLALASLAWSQPLFGEFITLIIVAAYLILEGKIKFGSNNSLIEATLLALMFFVFLSFYIFRSALPITYGGSFLAAVLLIFLITSVQFETISPSLTHSKLSILILVTLISEALVIFLFLPHGYLSLAAITLAIYVFLSRLTISFLQANVGQRRWLIELGITLGTVFLIFISSGVKPR